MADYRELSQEYAQGAIKAAILLNGGAAVALLTQLSALPSKLAGPVLWSMCFWAFGVALGAFCWVLAFVSTRYVDKFEREDVHGHIVTSDRYMMFGIASCLLSIATFLCGTVVLAMGFYSASAS